MVDLVQELRDIEQLARETRVKIAEGRVPNGASTLRKIEERAQDAARFGEQMATRPGERS